MQQIILCSFDVRKVCMHLVSKYFWQSRNIIIKRNKPVLFQPEVGNGRAEEGIKVIQVGFDRALKQSNYKTKISFLETRGKSRVGV